MCIIFMGSINEFLFRFRSYPQNLRYFQPYAFWIQNAQRAYTFIYIFFFYFMFSEPVIFLMWMVTAVIVTHSLLLYVAPHCCVDGCLEIEEGRLPDPGDNSLWSLPLVSSSSSSSCSASATCCSSMSFLLWGLSPRPQHPYINKSSSTSWNLRTPIHYTTEKLCIAYLWHLWAKFAVTWWWHKWLLWCCNEELYMPGTTCAANPQPGVHFIAVHQDLKLRPTKVQVYLIPVHFTVRL